MTQVTSVAGNKKINVVAPPLSLFVNYMPPVSVFLDHLGIATVDFEFQQDPAADYGVCESNST